MVYSITNGTFEGIIANGLHYAFGDPSLAAVATIIAWVAFLAIYRVPSEISLVSAGLLVLLFASPFVSTGSGDVVGTLIPAPIAGIILLLGTFVVAFALYRVFGR